MVDHPIAVPVFMRVGDGTETHIGDLRDPAALPDLLRAVADEADKQPAPHPESEH